MSFHKTLKLLESNESQEITNALTNLASQTKSSVGASLLFDQGGFGKVYSFLDNPNIRFKSLALSVLGNCTNLCQKWRRDFYNASGVQQLAIILKECEDHIAISRAVRLLANLAKDSTYLAAIQEQRCVISALVKFGSSSLWKCQSACLRAIRIICCTAKSARMAAENENFSSVLILLKSTSETIVLLCLRMIGELLKTQCKEIGYRCIEGETLSQLMQLSKHDTDSIKDYCVEILFLLTLNSSFRVTVAMEGGIEIFLDRICSTCSPAVDTLKYAIQALCLCAREAVSRNRMKSVGALPSLVDILQQSEFVRYHESIVAAFVFFLFDDSSLGLLIRANVIPALLKYLDKLILVEYEYNTDSSKAEPSCKDPEDSLSVSSDSSAGTRNIYHQQSLMKTPERLNEQSTHFPLFSSPETSPYYASSPQYSLPSFSPHSSPNYSPPTSPITWTSLDYGSYSENSMETSITSNVPYHFQSADGIHAMFHGTRGPIHDTLLLLSRFSQANDPSSFFLILPGFNTMLDYLLLSNKPNPKCARILNRLSVNSHCFDTMIKLKLVPRLYLRLCTGWSLENLTKMLEDARTEQDKAGNIARDTDDETKVADSTNWQLVKEPSIATLSLGHLLVSNIRSQTESSYGKGVFSHILLTGSQESKETSILSLPHIIWSVRLQKRLFFDLKAFDLLISLVAATLQKDSETIVLIVEAVCALARLVGLSAEKYDDVDDFAERAEKETTCESRPCQLDIDAAHLHRKRKRYFCRELDSVGDEVVLKFPSNLLVTCSVNKLVTNSLVFEQMFSSDYVDTQKPFIAIDSVHEQAFLSLLHYMHGCRVSITEQTECPEAECKFISVIKGRKKCKLNDKSVDEQSSSSIDENKIASDVCIDGDIITSDVCGYFTCQLLACCERFFVNELKAQCEQYLVSCLHSDNVVNLFLFASRHNLKVVLLNSLVYLVTSVDCPLKRTQYFVELLSSPEHGNFVVLLRRALMEACQRKQICGNVGTRRRAVDSNNF